MLNNKVKNEINHLSNSIIGAAIEVHKSIGPGLLESTYEDCLCYELKMRGINFDRQVKIPVIYKGQKLPNSYRIDLLIEDKIIVEIKSVEQINPVFESQLLTYLRHTNTWLGLLINFNVPLLKTGIRRIANDY